RRGGLVRCHVGHVATTLEYASGPARRTGPLNRLLRGDLELNESSGALVLLARVALVRRLAWVDVTRSHAVERVLDLGLDVIGDDIAVELVVGRNAHAVVIGAIEHVALPG